jgi:hypothetical protein
VRRPATWLAVGVVLLVGVAAAADGLRQKAAKSEVSSTTTTTPAGTTTRASPATGLSGVLYYTDQQCLLVARRLPDLRPVRSPAWNECGFSLSDDADRVAAEGFVWHPGGTVRASQSEGSVAVVLEEGSSESSYAFRGSAPSFSPQARLTFGLGTEIRMMDAGCPLLVSDEPLVPARAIRRCSTVIVPREAVERAARRHPSFDRATGFLSVSIRETVWLRAQQGPNLLATLLRLRTRTAEEFDLIGLFELGAIAETIALFETGSGLEASPGGSFFGVQRERGSVLLFDRDGSSLSLPHLTGAREFAWSPNESWVAIATERKVLVATTKTPTPLIRELDIDAGDIAWAGEP